MGLRLSWLGNGYSRHAGIILTHKAGQTIVFGVLSAFISRSVLARLQVCSGYDLCYTDSILTSLYE